MNKKSKLLRKMSKAKKKRIRAEDETIHPTQGNWFAYGGKKKRTENRRNDKKKEKKGAGPQLSYLDHLAESY